MTPAGRGHGQRAWAEGAGEKDGGEKNGSPCGRGHGVAPASWWRTPLRRRESAAFAPCAAHM